MVPLMLNLACSTPGMSREALRMALRVAAVVRVWPWEAMKRRESGLRRSKELRNGLVEEGDGGRMVMGCREAGSSTEG